MNQEMNDGAADADNGESAAAIKGKYVWSMSAVVCALTFAIIPITPPLIKQQESNNTYQTNIHDCRKAHHFSNAMIQNERRSASETLSTHYHSLGHPRPPEHRDQDSRGDSRTRQDTTEMTGCKVRNTAIISTNKSGEPKTKK